MNQLLPTALPLTLSFIMFSLGLGLTLADFKRVFVNPKAISLGIIAQLVLLPVIALILIKLVALPPELAFGVLILAFCPGGVMSNMISKLSEGDVALSISLTGIVSFIAVFSVSLLVPWTGTYFLGEGVLSVNAAALGLAMFMITALPAGLGVLLRHLFSGPAERLEPFVMRMASFLFLAIVALSIVSSWELLLENIVRLGPLLIAFNLILVILGFAIARLFKLEPRQVITLAIEAGMQNSALGITTGSLIVESQNGLPAFSLPSGVYGVVSYFVMLPFIFYARHYLKKHNVSQNSV